MRFTVKQIHESDPLWHPMAAEFPEEVAWFEDPGDEGDYHFFAASEGGEFIGGCVVDVSPLGFGPLAGMMAGFLEDISVLEEHRRKGVGTALLVAALGLAWDLGSEHVRWTVDYDNPAAIALYHKTGAAFIPDEDPAAAEPVKRYTVVAIRPR